MGQDANSPLGFSDKNMGLAQSGTVSVEHHSALVIEHASNKFSQNQVDSEYSNVRPSLAVATPTATVASTSVATATVATANTVERDSGVVSHSSSASQIRSEVNVTHFNLVTGMGLGHPIEVAVLDEIVVPVGATPSKIPDYPVTAPAPEVFDSSYAPSAAPNVVPQSARVQAYSEGMPHHSHAVTASVVFSDNAGRALAHGNGVDIRSTTTDTGDAEDTTDIDTDSPAQAVVVYPSGFATTYDIVPENYESTLKFVQPQLTSTDVVSLINVATLDFKVPISAQTQANTQSASSTITTQRQSLQPLSTFSLPSAQAAQSSSKRNRRKSSDTSDLPLFGAEVHMEDELGDDNTVYTIVKVAVNYPLFTTFDYKVAGEFDDSIAGCRVKISFGKNKSKKEIGIILGRQDKPLYEIKKIKVATLLDQKPLITPDLLQTLVYGAEYYHYPIGQVLGLALPKILREGGAASYKEIPGLQSMVETSVLEETLESIRSMGQKELLIELKHGPKRRRELREQGFTSAQELVLIKKGLVKKIDLSHKLLKTAPCPKNLDELYLNQPLQLNDEQKLALDEINSQEDYGVFLLNGVTGSGKTEVYLQVIAHTLMQGKKALVLVPEISLTPQTFKRFFHRFKVQIATLHSTLSDRERLDGFLDMYSERAMILIGTRSALFTPIPNLGLIVIDEEHDSSFKQNDGFRYHTRTLALYRAQLNQCKVVLGSATPSLDSLYQVQQGNYKMLFLKQRAHNSRMPTMQIVDLKQNGASSSMSAGIGRTLEMLIGINSVRHQQSILFINRRGYSHQMFCNSCEKIIQCPHCDVPMTVHRSLNMLICHVCNTQMPIPQCCPYCGCMSVSENGVGTEQVEQYLKMRFMDVGVSRVDRDTVSTKAELEETLNGIRSHKSEIIVGTQMLAKGHDFPDVTLVGILNVDSGLYSDDFRALEQTVQLVTQVAGRAGRANKPGRVVIQTMFPEHQILLRLTNPKFDYTELANEMLALRKAVDAPPYAHQAVVMANGSDRDAPFKYLYSILAHLAQFRELNTYARFTPVLPDRIEKKINRYHYHFIISCIWRDYLHKTLDEVQRFQQQMPMPSDLRFSIDVDPIISP